MLAWRRHGPVVYRLRALFAMVMTLLATCVLALVSLSVLSLYPGAGAIRPGASEQPVRATVKECHRVGPLSGYGMGYWWICQAAVRHDVGPERQVELGRSIVGPDDVGQVVELRAVCRGGGETDCYYGRPMAFILVLGYAIVEMALKVLVIGLLFAVGVYLLKAVLGAPAYVAIFDRRRRAGGVDDGMRSVKHYLNVVRQQMVVDGCAVTDEYVGSMPAVVGYRAKRWAGTRMHVFAVAAQADRVDEERLRAFSDAVVNLALTRTGDSRGVQTVLVLPILITESADAAATSLTRTAYRLHLAGVAVLAQPAVADVRARKVWAFRGTRSRGHAHHSLIAEKYVIYLPEPAAR